MKLNVDDAKSYVEAASRKEALWKELESHSALAFRVIYVLLFAGLFAYPYFLGGRESLWGAYVVLAITFSILFVLLHNKLNSVIAIMREYDRQ